MENKVQMMDAGMVLFQSEKPFGTVLGGIKTEMQRYGKVYRRNEMPDVGDYDLLLELSSSMRTSWIVCRLEDAGTVSVNEDGEVLHRYAACFMEGNANTTLRKVLASILATFIIALGIIGFSPVPKSLTVVAAVLLAGFVLFQCLRPSRSSQKKIAALIEIIKEAE